MLRFRAIAGLALCGAILAGCKKPSDATPAGSSRAPATPAAASPQSPASPATPNANVVPGSAHPLSVPSLPPDSSPLTTTTPSGDQTSDARKLLTAIAVDTAGKKWDAAAADFKKLDAMQLTPELKEAVTKAHEQFVAARTAGSITLPGLPGATTAPSNVEPPNK